MARPFATGRLFIDGSLAAVWDICEGDSPDEKLCALLAQFPDLPERLHMFELEFHNRPIEDRFQRFGNDPRFMVAPARIH